MGFLVRDKSFYRKVLTIALPVAGQNLINFGISMADTVMLGMLGDVEISAANLANQLGFVFMLFCFGMGSGSNVMIAQFWGNKDIKSIHRVMTIMYRCVFVVSLLFSALAMCVPQLVMSIFTDNREVIQVGAVFLRIVGASYLLSGISTTTMFVLRGVGSVRIALVVYLSSLVTNVGLNYVLIFGKLGFPAMGAQGAAIATCIARVVEVTIALVYLFGFEKTICYKLRYLFTSKLKLLREYIRNAFPVVINEVLWGGGVAVSAIIIGRMGTEFVTANAVCMVLSQLITIAISGTGQAAAVVIGNAVGAGEYDKVRQYAKTFLLMALVMGPFGSLCVLILRDPVIGFYNISELAKVYAYQIINVYAIVVIFQSFTMMTIVGILRGAGDTRVAMLIDVVFMWFICIPLGFYGGLYLGWAVPAVYAIIKCDEAIKTVAVLLRLRQNTWIHDVTKM